MIKYVYFGDDILLVLKWQPTVGKGVIKNNLLPVAFIAFEHFSLPMSTKMLFEI